MPQTEEPSMSDLVLRTNLGFPRTASVATNNSNLVRKEKKTLH